jgi:hypothetical protein
VKGLSQTPTAEFMPTKRVWATLVSLTSVVEEWRKRQMAHYAFTSQCAEARILQVAASMSLYTDIQVNRRASGGMKNCQSVQVMGSAQLSDDGSWGRDEASYRSQQPYEAILAQQNIGQKCIGGVPVLP